MSLDVEVVSLTVQGSEGTLSYPRVYSAVIYERLSSSFIAVGSSPIIVTQTRCSFGLFDFYGMSSKLSCSDLFPFNVL